MHHAHQLSLRVPDLIMQSSQHVLSRFRMVVLHKIHITPDQISEQSSIVTFEKESAIIAKHFGFDDQQVGDHSR